MAHRRLPLDYETVAQPFYYPFLTNPTLSTTQVFEHYKKFYKRNYRMLYERNVSWHRVGSKCWTLDYIMCVEAMYLFRSQVENNKYLFTLSFLDVPKVLFVSKMKKA